MCTAPVPLVSARYSIGRGLADARHQTREIASVIRCGDGKQSLLVKSMCRVADDLSGQGQGVDRFTADRALALARDGPNTVAAKTPIPSRQGRRHNPVAAWRRPKTRLRSRALCS